MNRIVVAQELMRIAKDMVAGGGISRDALLAKIKRALLTLNSKINHELPECPLTYAKYALHGKLNGQDVEVFFNSQSASNGEVAAQPVVKVGTKTFAMGFFGYDAKKIADKIKQMANIHTASMVTSSLHQQMLGLKHSEKNWGNQTMETWEGELDGVHVRIEKNSIPKQGKNENTVLLEVGSQKHVFIKDNEMKTVMETNKVEKELARLIAAEQAEND